MKTLTRITPSLVRKRVHSILLSACIVLLPHALRAQFDLNFACAENRTVELSMLGTVDSLQATMMVMGDTSLVDSILVELALKGNPVFWGPATVETSAGEVVVIPFPGLITNTGSNEEAAIYRAWVGSASKITAFTPVMDTLHYDDWQSMTLFEVRNGGSCVSGSTSGGDLLIFHFCDSLYFVLDSVAGPTKDVHVAAPLSEIGDVDSVRTAIVSINYVHEGVITNVCLDTFTGLDNTDGRNALLYEKIFQLGADIDSVMIVFISPDGPFGPFTSCTQQLPFGGDSFIIGTVVVSSDCDDCCQVNADCAFPDIQFCTFDSIPAIADVFLDSMATYVDTVNLDSTTFIDLGGTYTTSMCDTVYVQAVDSILGTGCGLDTGFVTRYYVFYNQSSGAPVDTCIQRFIVIDDIPPVISCPANVTVECTESTDPADTGMATAMDDCSTAMVTYSDQSSPGACPQEYIIMRTWTAEDACGNIATCVQTIQVEDSTAPVISCPADAVVECDGSTDPAATGVATATDNCDSAPLVTYVDVLTPGACPHAYSIARTWTATDACGNVASCVQTITVDDTTPPVITCPAEVVVECDESTDPAATGVATATDNCDSAPLVTYVDVLTPGACPQEFIIARTWTAMDACGNTAACVQTITVDDTTPPVITCPADITLECDESTDPVDTGIATASDNCSTPVVTYSETIVPGACPQQYTIFRNWTATDACGNLSSCLQTISVDDTTAPVISCPAHIGLECLESTDPANTGIPTATDNCGLADVTYSDETVPGACIFTFTITRTWSAVDSCGNVATCAQIIRVSDVVNPVLICPDDILLQCEDDLPPVLTTIEAFIAAGGTASDNCALDSASFDVIADFTDGESCPETRTRVYQVSDLCGNISTCSHTIIIDDTEPPVLVCQPDMTIDCSEPIPAPDVMITDNCGDPAVFPISALVPGDCPGEFTIYRSWTAVDDCGNSASCTQTITVLDLFAPEISCPDDVTLQPGDSIDPAVTGTATATDNCDGDPFITYSDMDAGCVIIRTWSAEDTCGNVSTCDQLLIFGAGPFFLVCPDDITVSCLTDLDSIPGIPDEVLDCGDATITYFDDLIYAGECDSAFLTKYTRTYFAVDDMGNTSSCTQMIFFEALDLGDVDFPPNFTGMDALPCFPPPDTSPAGTGSPEIEGVPIVNGQVCNISATYSDVVVPLCSGGYKIFRTWLVTDWCAGNETIDSVQIIEVADLTPPEVNAPDSVFASAGPDCLADVEMPPAEVSEDCSGTFTVRMQGTFGTIFSNGGIIPDLPVGVHQVIYIATNECTLEGRDTTIVIVRDDVPPTPICKASIVVTLNSMGMSLVGAGVFDGGSYDNCGPVWFKARRMDEPVGFDCFVDGNPEYLFDDYVKFCCGDVGNDNLMVILRVYDIEPVPGPVADDYLSGSFRDCMLRVEVQDKVPPQIECPSDLTISCMFPFDPANLSVFGDVVTDPVDREEICIDDIGNPGTFGLTCIGLDGIATDNCNVSITDTAFFDLNMCGAGTITRIFTATDDGGFITSCQQVITVIDYTPFDEGDISWPPDYETEDVCDVDLLDPEDLPFPYNGPVLADDECAMVVATYEDIVFDFTSNQQACFKILRTWTVLDWCQYDQNGAGIWTAKQVIKVHNTIGPEITLPSGTITVCTNDPNCGPAQVLLEADATDDCSAPQALRWLVRIDEGNNGSFDDSHLTIGVEHIERLVELPLGEHRVLYTVEDFCGNATTVEQIVNILSCKPPSAKCRNLTTTLMPVDTDGDLIPDWGMVTLWASDLDAGSDHACGNPVTVAFSADENDTSRVFDCAHLGENIVELWVIDDHGNTDFCTVTITIQDNFDVCPDDVQERAIISGAVATAEAHAVPDVEMYLNGSQLPAQMTDSSGGYIFPPMPHGGAYEVMPFRNTDHKKGVSTLDLIVLQKHLLGYQALDDPYQFIAADANRSATLSAMDIVVLRRLILGIVDTIQNNTSWRFVDADYQFLEPTDPLQEVFPESYNIAELNTDMPHVDFVAVKIGDLNGSAMQDLHQGELVETRSGRPVISMHTPDRMLEAGKPVLVRILCKDPAQVSALQFALEWDRQKVSVIPEVSGAMLGDQNWNASACADGFLPVSWTSLDPNESESRGVLITLRITPFRDLLLSETGLGISGEVMPVEGLLADGRTAIPVLTILPVSESMETLLVYQNRPNPFSIKTMIPVVMPEEGKLSVEVHRIDGSLVYQNQIDAHSGYHEIMLDVRDLGGEGIYTCTITTASEYRTMRMIVVGE